MMGKSKLGTVWIIDGSDACFTSYEEAKRFQEECNSDINYRDVDDEDIQPYELFAYVPSATMMDFPKTVDEFLKHYSFKDKKELYTNGSDLIPVFRVEQMLNHYFHTDI